MKFEKADEVLHNVPYTGSRKGKFLYDFIIANEIKNVLELGVAHGTSTCYIAAALAEAPGTRLTAVDLIESAEFQPNAEQQLNKLGLSDYVSVVREISSYTWFLKKQIQACTVDGVCEPVYDLCFIDGPKDWTNDGAAFFMVDKLLRHGGWILFDDYSWSYRNHERLTGTKHVGGYVFNRMGEDELEEPHVASIFDLLVRQHQGYSNFSVIDNDLAIAQKKPGTKMNSVKMKTAFTPGFIAFMAGRWISRKIR